MADERKDDDLSKDFNVPKAFQDAFVDTAQFDKVWTCLNKLT